MITDSAKKACIFSNGELKNSTRAKRAASNCDLLIAADGGTKHFVSLELQPKVIIGDMDPNTIDMWKDENNIVRIPHSLYRDKSDVELAVEYALKQGCQEILLIAAVDSRFDHTLVNVALVAGNPGRIAILDGASTLVAVDKSEKCMLHGYVGTPVSLIPYGSGSFTVRTKGLKSSLVDEPLRSATHGLSNELSQTEACVCVSNGVLLIYIENEDVYYKTQQ